MALALTFGIWTGTAVADQTAHTSSLEKAKQLERQANQLDRAANQRIRRVNKINRRANRINRRANQARKRARRASGRVRSLLLTQSRIMKRKVRVLRGKGRVLRRKANGNRRRAKALRKEARRLREQALNNPAVTIRTTEYGYPRIVADDWRGLGYGYGYALAKQNICSMAQIYTTVRGERSKYFGPDGSWQLSGNGINYTNLQADFAHKRVIAEDTISKILKMKAPNGPKPEAREAVTGYVKGYNRYLKDVGVNNLSDVTCKGKPWVKPITEQDVYLRFFELGTMAGLGVAVDGTADAAPPISGASADAQESQQEITPADVEAFKAHDPQIGSNAVGLGSETTSTGKGMLYGNPHFPWQGSERFFEAQITIPGKVNASGGSLLGVPVVLIGHNQNLAWSHTVSTARRFSMYQEKLVPGDPTSYYVDGKQTAMKKTKVTVEVKQPDDSITKETRTLYSTIHGPVATILQKQPLFGWTNTTAYTMFDANANGLRFINHFFDFNRAQSVDEGVKVLKEDLGVPWVNTIAADSKGNALYADVGSMPNIDDARAAECNTGFAGISWPSLQVAVFEGWNSSCDMQKAPDAPAVGLLSPSKMPIQVRKDYTSNANDSYWLSNPNDPFPAKPHIIGDIDTARSLRTRNGLNQIEQRLAGTDGNPGNKYTPELLRGFINNNRNYGAELLIPDLVAWCQTLPPPATVNGVDVSQACTVLAGWDHTEKLDSPGAYLGRRVLGRILSASGGIFNTPFAVANPVHTPSDLNTANPNVQKALSDSVTELNSKSIPLDATLRSHQFVTRAGDQIPIPGGSGGQGVYNVISAVYNSTTGNYDNVVHGSSFIVMANMDGSKCPDVKNILTYSQAATDESSPHFNDQTKLFSNGGWVTDRFCAADQKASPGLNVKNLNGGAQAVKKGW
ncbi:MAG: penicillin acylase family protein [Solirubrobacterales bacterium]|nr:penicillin acylase family protein [Solirubrobacterales bacterium]